MIDFPCCSLHDDDEDEMKDEKKIGRHFCKCEQQIITIGSSSSPCSSWILLNHFYPTSLSAKVIFMFAWKVSAFHGAENINQFSAKKINQTCCKLACFWVNKFNNRLPLIINDGFMCCVVFVYRLKEFELDFVNYWEKTH